MSAPTHEHPAAPHEPDEPPTVTVNLWRDEHGWIAIDTDLDMWGEGGTPGEAVDDWASSLRECIEHFANEPTMHIPLSRFRAHLGEAEPITGTYDPVELDWRKCTMRAGVISTINLGVVRWFALIGVGNVLSYGPMFGTQEEATAHLQHFLDLVGEVLATAEDGAS